MFSEILKCSSSQIIFPRHQQLFGEHYLWNNIRRTILKINLFIVGTLLENIVRRTLLEEQKNLNIIIEQHWEKN